MTDLGSRQTPPSLLIRIRDAQDAESWQTFVDVYAPLIYRYYRHHRLQDADAADVTQEVLAQVARSIRSFDYQPERGRFRDWLGVVALNKLRQFLRKEDQQVRGRGGLDSEACLDGLKAMETDTAWTAQFNAHLLQVALERIRPHFEPASWLAFERTWLKDCSAAETAAALGLPITTVYVAKSRVLKRLREEVLMLAEDFPGGPC